MLNRRKLVQGGAISGAVLSVGILLGSYGAASAASDAGVVAVEQPAIDAGAVAAPTSEVPPTSEVGSNDDLVQKLKETKEAYDALKGHKDGPEPRSYLIAALIAALANLLISGIKRTMKITGKAKRVLPWIAVGLGAVITTVGYFTSGIGLTMAIFYGGAAAGSIVLQELGLIPIGSSDKKADAES